MVKTDNGIAYSPFRHVTRETWKTLNGHPNYVLADEDIRKLNALNEPLTMQEIEEVYFPLSHLLRLHIDSFRQLHRHTNSFFDNHAKHLPFIIVMPGIDAARKSTSARVLQKLLSLSPGNLIAELISRDGFLYPTGYLEPKRILNRKGLPESSDARRLFA